MLALARRLSLRGFASYAGSIAPHGGALVNRVATGDELAALKAEAVGLKSVQLNLRQVCDLEMIMNGAFSPLKGFMSQADYKRVVKEMRLADGTLFPIPVTFDLNKDSIDKFEIAPGMSIALRDPEFDLVAVLDVDEVYKPDKEDEAQQVLGTTSPDHPGVSYLRKAGEYYLGGKVRGVQLPVHYDFVSSRRTPQQLRQEFDRLGWQRVVNYQTRNPIHKPHMELTVRAAEKVNGHLLISPVVGSTSPGDFTYPTRVMAIRSVLARYPSTVTPMVNLTPLSMRMGGPREALFHTIISKNYGATHVIVGRDHASPYAGGPYYETYAAQDLVRDHADEVGIVMQRFKELVWVKEQSKFYTEDKLPAGLVARKLQDKEFRERLAFGSDIPNWYSFTEILGRLRRASPPRSQQGMTLFFTGLSGSGKSTVANAVVQRLNEEGTRQVTLLDGDIVRTNLSSELGFSKEDRDKNVMRIAYVASLIARSGGIALCAPIAPYANIRAQARELTEDEGRGFFEVFFSTPIEACEDRDRKGLYAKARKGLIKGFTGIDDPYEAPENPEITLDTSKLSIAEAANKVIAYLRKEGYLASE